MVHPFLRRLRPTLHISHRGGAMLAPENTLVAFRLATDRFATDMLELDVRATADGELVVIHDATLERTTDIVGAVNAFTWSERRVGTRRGRSQRRRRAHAAARGRNGRRHGPQPRWHRHARSRRGGNPCRSVPVPPFPAHPRELGIENPKTGGLNVLQRFGGSLNFNPHTLMAAIDGVYSFDGTTGAPAFHFIDPPTKQELTELVHELSRRVTRMLERRGLIRDCLFSFCPGRSRR